jgi:SAM-dependent methyltransferase
MFDGSMSLLHQARQNTSGTAFYIAGDLLHNPFKTASFDTILMIRVFHHLTDSKACLSELYRMLPGNGRLVFTYKNIANPMHILKWLARKEPGSPFSLEPSSINLGLLAHHPIYIHRTLIETGFTNLQYQGLGILDKFAKKKGLLGKWTPTGKKLAPFFGRIKVAPWMFCSGISNQKISLTECSQLDDLLICPKCKGGLLHETNHYTCVSCQHSYPIADDILDFRIE